MKTISPLELHELRKGHALALLDVRTPAEHAEVHIPGAHLLPLDRLEPDKLAETNGFSKSQPVYIVCHSGNRAKQAASRLSQAGFVDCVVVEGGTVAWAEAGLPVNRQASKVISLERQVRIAAGSIVLVGVLLAQFVAPQFIWLSGFVGAGLIFAGVTDWCGMGLLLARLPWNQRGISKCGS